MIFNEFWLIFNKLGLIALVERVKRIGLIERVYRFGVSVKDAIKPDIPTEEPEKKDKHYFMAEILGEVIEPEFAEQLGKRPRYGFNSAKSFRRYKKTYAKVHAYLSELREDYESPTMERMVEDYFRSIYQRYAHFKTTPYVTQLGPTEKNCEGYDIYIHKCEEFYEHEYFSHDIVDKEKIHQRVARHFKGREEAIEEDGELNILDI